MSPVLTSRLSPCALLVVGILTMPPSALAQNGDIFFPPQGYETDCVGNGGVMAWKGPGSNVECVRLPSGTDGGSCKAGEALTFTSAGFSCASITSGVSVACPDGYYLQGILNGTAVCRGATATGTTSGSGSTDAGAGTPGNGETIGDTNACRNGFPRDHGMITAEISWMQASSTNSQEQEQVRGVCHAYTSGCTVYLGYEAFGKNNKRLKPLLWTNNTSLGGARVERCSVDTVGLKATYSRTNHSTMTRW